MPEEILSYAKINIGLHIGDRRPDGYHNIETIFKLVSLCDRILLDPLEKPGVQITSNHHDMPTDESNLAVKALRLLERETGRTLPTHIFIEKKIPIGAGLGGGSSNGAVVLVGLNRVFRLNLPKDRLMAMGAELGSDVPFFVGHALGMGTTALGTGRGESLEFFDWHLDEQVILTYPRIPISTAWAYQNFSKYKDLDGRGKAKNTLTNRGVSAILSAPWTKKMFFDNDFEPLVFAKHDKIRLQRQSLLDHGAIFSSLSGSGSTVFGLFNPDQNISDSRSWMPDCDVFNCQFVR